MSNIFLRPRRGKKSTMSGDKANLVLKSGEMFIETPDTGVGKGASKIKVGDGSTPYSSLPYALGDTSNEVIDYAADSSTSVSTVISNAASGNKLNKILAALKQGISLLNTNMGKYLPLAGGTVSGTTTINGIRTISVSVPDNAGASKYLLMYDVTTWYNSTTTGQSSNIFTGFIYSQRTGGSMKEEIATVYIGTSYKKVETEDASNLILRTNSTNYYPCIIYDSVNSKYYLALRIAGSGRTINLQGKFSGTYIGTFINCTSGTTLPDGYSLAIDDCRMLSVPRAISDSYGNNIASTYATKTENNTKLSAAGDTLEGKLLVGGSNIGIFNADGSGTILGYNNNISSGTSVGANSETVIRSGEAENLYHMLYVGGTKYTILDSGNFTNFIVPDTIGAQAAGNYANAAHTHANADITSIDAGKITSGTISISRLPAGALERLVVVADDTARYALTSSDVQAGDTVKVTSTGLMWFVVDTSKLTSDSGYVKYSAGAATTATQLATARKIGNASFNGTADITLATMGAAPISHASSATTYGAATASNYGHVKLSDTYASKVSSGAAANGLGASQNALYNAYNTLNNLITTINNFLAVADFGDEDA